MAKITRLTLDQGGGLDRRRLHLHEISEDADVPLETVGQDLRKARLRKGEDLASISAVLKIRRDQLEALEESNFDSLPGRPYTIGFVRGYAQYLGLNSGECVERLKAEIAGRNEIKEPVIATPPSDNRLPQGAIVLGAFLAIALIYVGYYVVVAVGRMHTPAVTPVPARLSEMTGPILPIPAPQRVAGTPTMTQISGDAADSEGNHL